MITMLAGAASRADRSMLRLVPVPTPDELTRAFRNERQHALATLIRLLGDWDVAEEALQEAFAAAVTQWTASPGGTPENPRAWLVRTAHHKGIDRLRRRARFREKESELVAEAEALLTQ